MRLGNDGHTGAELYGAMDRKDTEVRKILLLDAMNPGPESKEHQRRTA